MIRLSIALLSLAIVSGCGDDDRPAVDAGRLDGGPAIVVDGGGRMDGTVIRDAGGPPECVGMATDCATLDVASCETVMGCLLPPSRCMGLPRPCAGRSSDDCAGGAGTCMWTGTMCTGMPPVSCGDIPGDACLDEPGCVESPFTCRGMPTPCSSLSRETCTSQPGCMLYVPPRDGGPPGFDGGCGTFDAGTGMVDVPVHVVVGPAPVRSAPNALVRIESLCGGSMEAMTDASGNASFTVERGMGPWDLTAAMPGHSALSIVDVASIALDGDIRLDPLGRPPELPQTISGTLTGAVGIGHTVQVDAYNFETIPAAGPSWSSNYYFSPRSLAQPLTFMALELDGTGRAVSAATTEVPRTMTLITGVVVAMPSPAVAPSETSAMIVLPTSGMATGLGPMGAYAESLSSLDEGQYLYTGTAQLRVVGPNLRLTVQHFPGVVPTNFAGATAENASGRLNVYVYDFSGPTAPEIVVGAGDVSTRGSTLGDLVAVQTGGTEHDVVALHIGESTTDIPRWRVYAPTLPALTRVPSLPAGVTLEDIGLSAGSPTSVLSLFIEMDSGRAWSTESQNHGVPTYRYSIAGSYGSVVAAGR